MRAEDLGASWAAAVGAEFDKPYFQDLDTFVATERAAATIYPPENEVFTTFRALPFGRVKVLLLGQDPYHGANQAHGLSFSVKPGVGVPPSLYNMYKELRSDLSIDPPDHGCLLPWVQQGMMMLNAVLTVREATPGAHAGKGWEKFTDAVIKALDARPEPVVFVLWGGYAKKKAKLIKGAQHRVFEGTHPSPLSASAGFFGSKPYSRINALLEEVGHTPIDWKLPKKKDLVYEVP